MRAGADFIKTSTGKVAPAATLPVTLVMLEAIRDLLLRHRPPHRHETRRRHPHRERSARLSRHAAETLGDDWLTPDLFRFGASTLANDVLMQIANPGPRSAPPP